MGEDLYNPGVENNFLNKSPKCYAKVYGFDDIKLRILQQKA